MQSIAVFLTFILVGASLIEAIERDDDNAVQDVLERRQDVSERGGKGCTATVGFKLVPGDIPTWNGKGTLFGPMLTDEAQCGRICLQRSDCKSYEYSKDEGKCNLNKESSPTADPVKGYVFCVKKTECTNIKLKTKSRGKEISWKFGSCQSPQGYGENENGKYADFKEFTIKCCQLAGKYKLECKNNYGDGDYGGWHGGSIEIGGKEYCKDFERGHKKRVFYVLHSAISDYREYDKIWSDKQCRNTGIHSANSGDECWEKCKKNPSCTAVNFGGSNCVFRQCASPVPDPEWSYGSYIGITAK